MIAATPLLPTPSTPFQDSSSCWLNPETTTSLRGRFVAVDGEGPITERLRIEAALAGAQCVKPAHAEILLVRADRAGEELAGLVDGLGPEGFAVHSAGGRTTVVAAGEPGLLYGWFYLLRTPDWNTPIRDEPALPVRMMNHWDNLDAGDHLGSIERGYAGGSLFFHNGQVTSDLRRITDYARLLASTGVNALTLNNVNVHSNAVPLLDELLPGVARIADVLRGFAITTYLSVNFASPILAGDLDTADPADPAVAAWWAAAAQRVNTWVPDFGGFLVKAGSEGQPGPHDYGRNHAEGANLLARALAEHGGRVYWRCFVYNHRQDWRDRRTDRARAAYDEFQGLDGQFDDNVILQVKCGPMDFQVREPVSPLLLAMPRTNVVVEVQITQEYTGHQIDLCYLPPQWSELFQFPTTQGSRPEDTLVRSLLGVCGVSNVGDDLNWTGHDLAQANLHGFGRLAWNPAAKVDDLAREWGRLTFPDAGVQDTVVDLLLQSWSTYERYTAPLGVGWMVTPHTHYGPAVDGYEYSRWGTYHFADRAGVGVDRTVATGSGFAGQFPPAWAEVYEDVARCPDELLLFFHHVPYTHRLHSGTTVIQHIYDTHADGVEEVTAMRERWLKLRGSVEESLWQRVSDRFRWQLVNAQEWRDQVNTYFLRKSGIADVKSRVYL